MVYIRQEQLPKLKEYKYSGVDLSLTSKYVLKPFYKQFIKLIPLSVAPNMVTLSGFGFVVLNFLTMLWYNPTLDRDCPPWVYASFAIGLFTYQTFDAVDGSQARRTRQSGPLGELFDHSVDALNTWLEVLLFAGTMHLGQGWKTMLVLFAALLTFYVQTWDEYHTKTLTLGIISGPVEGILTLVIVYALTAYIGRGSYWAEPMLPVLGVSKSDYIPNIFYNMAWNEWYMVYGGIVLVFNTWQAADSVVRHRRKEGSASPAGALLGLAPFVLGSVLIGTYLHLQPQILRSHLVPFVFYAGLTNAYSVGQMITAHLTKSAFPYQNVLLLPLMFGVVDSLGPFFKSHIGAGWPSALGEDYQVSYVFLLLGSAIGIYGSFVHDVIVSICDYLDIWCLTIKHPYSENKTD